MNSDMLRILTIVMAINIATPLAKAADSISSSPSGALVNAAGGEVRAVIKARHQATLSSEIAGRITRLSLREGDRFTKGDKLVEFDCEALLATLGVVKSSLGRAQARLEGLSGLAAHHAAGSMDLALARADLEKARFEVRGASVAVDHCAITAPFSGLVVELKARVYETVAPNTPLLTILNDSGLEVSLVFPPTWLAWLKLGQRFSLDIDETRQVHIGKIVRLGAQIDPISQTIAAYGELDTVDRTIISGMSGTVRFVRP
ncbi:putative RND family efflux transporter, MFP subunit [Azospirillaceae bacterium]